MDNASEDGADHLQSFADFVRNDMVGSDMIIDTPYGSRKMLYADATASGRAMRSIEDVISSKVLPFYANTHSPSSSCGRQSTEYFEEARELIKNVINATDKDTLLFSGSGCTAAISKFAHIVTSAFASSSTISSSASTVAAYQCSFPGCKRRYADRANVLIHSRSHPDGEAHGFKPLILNQQELGQGPGQEPLASPERNSNNTTKDGGGSSSNNEHAKVIVLHGPMEHHSNILVWRELPHVKVVEVPPNEHGCVDKGELEQLLQHYSECIDTDSGTSKTREEHVRRYKHGVEAVIGTFSAASNVTGIREDVDAITATLHRYGALACWDYAAAGPHSKIDMNPPASKACSSELLAKDAVFFSPHKYVGGPGTPGVLVMKKDLLQNVAPAVPGGGTVFYVTSDSHRYLDVPEEKEEGGTKNIVGAIRAGLVFQLQSSIGYDAMEKRERDITAAVLREWGQHANITLLGSSSAPHRLPIFSFVVHGPGQCGKFLHWNFVAMLLNDLFGIQCRGGCLCAGPYGHRLLGISKDDSHRLQKLLVEKRELVRPGFVRLAMEYHWTDDMVHGVIEAVKFVASHGHLFLRDYLFYTDTGEYRHLSLRHKSPSRRWLHDVVFTRSGVQLMHSMQLAPPSTGLSLAESLVEAKRLALSRKPTQAMRADPAILLGLGDDEMHLRWFYVDGEDAELEATRRSTDTLGGTTSSPSSPDERKSAQDAAERIKGCIDVFGSGRTQRDSAPACPLLFLASSTSGDDDKATTTPADSLEASKPSTSPSITATPVVMAASSMDGLSKKERKKLLKKLWPPVPKTLLKPIGEAIREFSMIREGDRVLIGLSGGKDSLTLVHALHALQRKAPVRFQLGAVTVNPTFPGYDPSPLIQYMAKLGVPYFQEKQDLMAEAKIQKPSSICSWCSRMKRGILYTVARREGYNVLALGQHLDDLAESFLMSAFHNGKLRTMKAHYTIDAGDLRVIRPLAHVRERQTREFAVANKLPVIYENCPACFDAPQERYRIKTLLAQQEHLFPSLLSNLRKTMSSLAADKGLTGESTLSSATAATPRKKKEGGAKGEDAREEEEERERDDDEEEEEVKKRPKLVAAVDPPPPS